MAFEEFMTSDHYNDAISKNREAFNKLDKYIKSLWYQDSDPMFLELMEKPLKDITDRDRYLMDMNPSIYKARSDYAAISKVRKELEKRQKQLEKEQSAIRENEIYNVVWIPNSSQPATAGNTINESWAMWASNKAISAINENADNRIQGAAMNAAREWWYLKWLVSRTWGSMWETWLAADQQNAAFNQQALWINAGRNEALTSAYNNQSQTIQNLMQQRTDRIQAAQNAAATKTKPVFNTKIPPSNEVPIDIWNWDGPTNSVWTWAIL